MASTSSISALFLYFLLLLIASGSNSHPLGYKNRASKPCKRFSFYFHEIRYNGSNPNNSTSTIIGTPAGGNKLTFSSSTAFGDLIAFDNPLTLDRSLKSKPIGRAQGIYVYTGKEAISAFFSLSFVFRSKGLNGTLVFQGADTLTEATRDIFVMGGTGDFFMARGIATLVTVASDFPLYFTLHFDVKLYECW